MQSATIQRGDDVDAVSLMTVRAAKDLEFPIVFLVNVRRGTAPGTGADPIAASSGGLPAVAVADFNAKPTRRAGRASGRKPSGSSTWR